MKSVDMVTTTGPTASPTLDTGVKTKWTVKASSDGKMGKCILGSSSMTNAKAMELSSGPMVVNI